MPDVHMSPSGPPETVIPAESPEVLTAVQNAALQVGEGRIGAVQAVTGEFPGSLCAWVELGDVSIEPIVRYAAYRVGYHRGLDRLRQSGWRGSGYVRWQHESNRAFLRCLNGLGELAAQLGEQDEAQRCALFLRQLDPEWEHRGA